MTYTRTPRPVTFPDALAPEARVLIRGGRVIDPAHRLDAMKDLAIADGTVREVADAILPRRGDRVIDAGGLLVLPGIVDLHCHFHDLFDVSTMPATEVVAAGTAVALTPGAGNTLMAPALLGAEVDRGLPLHVGCYIGAAAVLSSRASPEQLIAYFRGELPDTAQLQVISRNPITNATGALAVGLKDHMGHWILSDEHLESCFAITKQAGMLFMSHCQDPEHAERLARLSRGRRVLLTHATAAGSGSHGDAVAGLEHVLALARDHPGVTLDFTTAHLRRSRGLRDGILIDARAQSTARDAIASGRCRLLTSDGPCNATMKGFGDARENIPCLLELAEEGVVPLLDAVAMMTVNPVRFAAEATGQSWWTEELGHLGPGARANVVLVEPQAGRAVMTLVEGRIAAFEGRCIRAAHGVGGWVSRTGLRPRLGVGDLPLFHT
jgi:dihydroorotase-like cyclic amidohydrolase